MMFRRRLAASAVLSTAAAVLPTAAGGPSTSMLGAAVSAMPPASAVPSTAGFAMVSARSYCTPSGGTALDVAMKVNKLKRQHQQGQGGDKKQIEQTAWRELNTLSESQISEAEGKAVALLLSSWAYFAKFWEKGKDGPLIAEDRGSRAQQEADR